jgi:hypothetical protein
MSRDPLTDVWFRLPPPQVQYYTAPHSQYRFFQRLAQAFVRVGLIDQTGTPNSYMPGASLSVKEAVSLGCKVERRPDCVLT